MSWHPEFVVDLLPDGVDPWIFIEEIQNVFVDNGAVAHRPNRTVSSQANVVEDEFCSFHAPRDEGRLA